MASNLNKNDDSIDDGFIPYRPIRFSQDEMGNRADNFKEEMNRRRSVRCFSRVGVPIELIRTCIEAAGTAPSGANKQPWSFCIVGDPLLKTQIRIMAEEEEFKSYNGRMSDKWLEDLKPLGTNSIKPFLEDAPYLIVVFKQIFEVVDGKKLPNYYVNESVGIATGILITALHLAGLCTLTHTPSPMNFLATLLHRPETEKPFLLIPVGFAAEDALVPNISRKPLDAFAIEYL